MKVQVLRPLHIRRSDGDLHLKPGTVELPDDDAFRLLSKRPDVVRQVGPVIIEPACRPDGSPLSPIYWERGDTTISGPATPLLFEQVGNDWVLVIDYRGECISINANTLRSRRQFQQQRKPQHGSVGKGRK
jgi:hypothetical protein